MKIERIKMSGGENYSVLLSSDGLPMPYPNLFVTLHHRNKSDASNTCYIAFEHLRYFYEICSFLNIDLVERCRSGDFLKKKEMETIAKWAKSTVKAFREHVAVNKAKNIIVLSPRKNKLETARATLVINHRDDIESSTAYNRLTTFSKYVGWLEQEFFPSKKSTTEQKLQQLRPRKYSPKGHSWDHDESYKSLTSPQVLRVLDVVRPDSPQNPWKNESLRFRNQLIINMLEAIGFRRGELLKVRTEDIKTNPNNGLRYVKVRSEVDQYDERLDRPEGKTLGRLVPMDKRLADMYDNYLINHRSNVNGAERIPYLFVTHHHRGSQPRALSSAAVNKLCREISEVVGFRVHPHAFRHAWNDKFSAHADKRIAEGKTSESKSESDRQKLMGWSEGSRMAKTYSKRHDDKRAFEVGLELQEKDSTKINSIVGAYDDDIDW
ncbi:tyrosine-type recombinase/integrase [Marinomonas lutimaris]|uniref:tyrosine-type recombinase/integrase n=1 Tax=Marinomonas lutimaris TaxID=2846746 RepID=UPI001C66DDB5